MEIHIYHVASENGKCRVTGTVLMFIKRGRYIYKHTHTNVMCLRLPRNRSGTLRTKHL